jgi:hypothetical protein
MLYTGCSTYKMSYCTMAIRDVRVNIHMDIITISCPAVPDKTQDLPVTSVRPHLAIQTIEKCAVLARSVSVQYLSIAFLA